MGQFDEETARRMSLKGKAYQIRRDAIEHGDFEGWRISRLLRDASTIEQIQEAERRLERWSRRARYQR